MLDGYACTLHWRSQPAFAEAFPGLALARSIYVIDRTRFTSAGGIGAFDMMLEIIGNHHGEDLVRQVAEWFVHDRIRATTDRERLQLRLRTGIRDELVLDAVPSWKGRRRTPCPYRQSQTRFAVSIEKLERAFKAEVGMGPAEYYKKIRLQRAATFWSTPRCRCGKLGSRADMPVFPHLFAPFARPMGKRRARCGCRELHLDLRVAHLLKKYAQFKKVSRNLKYGSFEREV